MSETKISTLRAEKWDLLAGADAVWIMVRKTHHVEGKFRYWVDDDDPDSQLGSKRVAEVKRDLLLASIAVHQVPNDGNTEINGYEGRVGNIQDPRI